MGFLTIEIDIFLLLVKGCNDILQLGSNLYKAYFCLFFDWHIK